MLYIMQPNPLSKALDFQSPKNFIFGDVIYCVSL